MIWPIILCVLALTYIITLGLCLRKMSKLDTGRKHRKHKTAPVMINIDGTPRPTMRIDLKGELSPLHLTMPSKQVSDCFPAMGRLMGQIAAGITDEATMDSLYETVATVLSCNTEASPVTAEMVRNSFQPDEAVALLADYLDFIADKIDEKN